MLGTSHPFRLLCTQTNSNAMTDSTTHLPAPFRPSITTDDLRPALLLAGTQVITALLGAVMLTNGALA